MATYLVDLENTGLAGLLGLEELSAKDKVIVFYGTRTGSIAFDKHVELTKAKADVTYTKTERVAKNYLDFQLVTYLGYLIGSGQERVYYIISKDKGYDSCIEFWRKTNKQIAITRCESLQKQKAVTQTAAQSDAGKGVQAAGGEHADMQKNPAPEPMQADRPVSGSRQSKQKASGKTSSTSKASGKEASDQKASEKKTSDQKKAEKPSLPESMRKKIRKAVKEEGLEAGSYKFIYDYVVKSSDKQKLNIALVKHFQQEKGNRLYKEILDVFAEYHKQNPDA
ncbi:MAG: hypothetical protein HDR21_10030 [Lachnospiraceae bacterium]|nr:hypothetical protein [Lachnospiraceae bacterium]